MLDVASIPHPTKMYRSSVYRGKDPVLSPLVARGYPAPHEEHPLRLHIGYLPDALRSFELHRARAESMGEVWSDDHAYAFLQLHQAYALTSAGMQHSGQTAWPFSGGTGKSESLVARVVDQAAQPKPRSVLIAVDTVAQASNAYRSMVDALQSAGFATEAVAVYHTKTAAEVKAEKVVASIAVSDIPRVPFLIVTHAMMLEGAESIEIVNQYGKGQRSLIVWDESLIKSEGGAFDLGALEGASVLLRSKLRDTLASEAREDIMDALSFVDGCTKELRDDFDAATGGAHVRTRCIPRLSHGDRRRFHAAVVTAAGREEEMYVQARVKLSNFIGHAPGREVRTISVVDSANQIRVGMIHYQTYIPRDLKRLIVLDASHVIRRLVNIHDADIRVTSVNCAVKRFDHVTVQHIVRGAGRGKLNTELAKADSRTTKLVLGAITGRPADESQLLVTFKLKDSQKWKGIVSDADRLKFHIRATGLDPDQLLPNGKRRLEFITWGQHVGVNHYAHCGHVLLVGVLRLPEMQIAANIAAAKDSLKAPEVSDMEEVKATLLSEMFHHVVQAGWRGHARTTKDGQAGRMHLTLLCSEEFGADLWDAAMPGVTIARDYPDTAERTAQRSVEAEAVLKVFKALRPSERRIKARVVLVEAGLADMKQQRSSELLTSLVEDIRKLGFARVGYGYDRTEEPPAEALDTVFMSALDIAASF